jgi:SPP1 family predicted phage head-tail adaptor
MADMKAGELNKRLTIQQPSATTNVRGGKTKGWEDLATVWGSLDSLSGREFFEAHQTETEISTRIRIRYMDGLNTYMRIKYGDRYFKIVSIIKSDAEIVIMSAETEDFR